MLSQENLIALGQQLARYRAALEQVCKEQVKHQEAIAAIKATLHSIGVPCDTSPYDGANHISALLIDDEAQRCLERAFGGPRAMTKWPADK